MKCKSDGLMSSTDKQKCINLRIMKCKYGTSNSVGGKVMRINLRIMKCKSVIY